jgi:hypothetical protein
LRTQRKIKTKKSLTIDFKYRILAL